MSNGNPNEQPTTQEVVAALFAYAADLMKAGHRRAEIEANLIENGVSQKTAAIVVQKLFSLRAVARKKVVRRLLLGASLWSLAGVGLMIGSALTGKGDGFYVLAGVAIVFGVMQGYKGWRAWRA